MEYYETQYYESRYNCIFRKPKYTKCKIIENTIVGLSHFLVGATSLYQIRNLDTLELSIK